MASIIVVWLWMSFWILWQSSYVRWASFHGPVGTLNYGIAILFFELFGFDIYIATTAGHVLHVFFGYFYDRDVSFRASKSTRRYAFVRYWTIEALSFGSIILTVYIVVDVLNGSVYLARFVIAMVVGSAISYGLNRYWTFARPGRRARARRPFCFQIYFIPSVFVGYG